MNSGANKMSGFGLVTAMSFAALFDLISLIPIIGMFTSFLFILLCRITFWLLGYGSKGSMALTPTTMIVEFIPGINILPGCMSFVFLFYLSNKGATT